MPRYDDEDEEGDFDFRNRGLPRELGWLDQQFRNTNVLILILFSLCCGWIALLFGILGVAICTDRKARSNATIVLVISGISTCLSVASVFIRIAARQ